MLLLLQARANNTLLVLFTQLVAFHREAFSLNQIFLFYTPTNPILFLYHTYLHWYVNIHECDMWINVFLFF